MKQPQEAIARIGEPFVALGPAMDRAAESLATYGQNYREAVDAELGRLAAHRAANPRLRRLGQR